MMNFMFLSPNVDNLVDYFKRSFGGSLEIDYKYDSLERNIEQLMNNNIRVDKLIIVFYDNSGFNIKREMTFLENLMSKNTYFKVNEIMLFSEKSEYCDTGISAFKFVMQNINFRNYTIKSYDSITTTQIYRDVMGIIPDDVTSTSYNIVYRVEKGSESKVGYSPRKLNKSLEPTTINGVKEYNKFKDNSVKTETGKLVVDVPPKEIQKIDIDLDAFNSEFDSIKNVIIFCGLPKSGTSALLCSSMFQTQDVLSVDLSRNLGTFRMLNKLTVGAGFTYPEVCFIDNKDLLFGTTYLDNKLKCCFNDKYELKIDYLKYILSVPNKISYNRIFIDCDLDSLDDIINLVGEKLRKLVFTCEGVREEFNLIKDAVNKYSKIDRYVFLNDYLSLKEGYSPLSPLIANTEVDGCKVIKGEKLFNDKISLDIFI